MTLSERLQRICEYKGISAKELQERCGMSSGYIKKIKNNLGPKKLEALLAEFPEISRDWIVFGSGSMLTAPETPSDGSGPSCQTGSFLELVHMKELFPGATSAIYHFGRSMVDYPNGCLLALRRVEDMRLIVNGKNYVIETKEFKITRQLHYDGGEFLVAYSSNRDTFPDGKLVYAPLRIPVEAVLHLDLVLGHVIRELPDEVISLTGETHSRD